MTSQHPGARALSGITALTRVCFAGSNATRLPSAPSHLTHERGSRQNAPGCYRQDLTAHSCGIASEVLGVFWVFSSFLDAQAG